MVTKVQKWGNSQGLRVTKELLNAARIEVGDDVEVLVRNGRIIVQPVTQVRGRYKLTDLVARIPKGHQGEEANWGPPIGNEAW